ncbi:GNAT family N-acetyltransferase [Flavobacterium magnum]|uniref:GNAT family N-acetyltransferase n=1 Tax=Flavobacterium magnum TaxID=2162713 RepID=A0A2S0R9A1_9FLAO|nr:GNAT family protein [Flavobacterium magnum]AWA28597.1 GNAT family N-acetyltransferase [Flavobacterium magnum]
MITLKGENIRLRALEPEDLDFIYEVENDESIWHVSNTQTPYSYYLIRQYLENAQQDIYEARQLRLAVCHHDDVTPIGLIDLFDFDPKNHRAGIGILIQNAKDRNKRAGTEALGLLIRYAFSKLALRQVYANIDTENEASIRLFTKFGFHRIGVKEQWNLQDGKYRDEALYQLLNPQF